MCFCAEASFAAAGALAITGLLSCAYIKNKSQLMFAAIPFIFGLQQAAEGILWITTNKPELLWLHTIAVHAFLFCAFVIWPTWMPLSFMMYENQKKKLLTYLTVLGSLVSAFLLLLMVFKHVAITTHLNHVQYLFGLPEMVTIAGTFIYAIPTIIPFFIPQKPLFTLMGFLIVTSAIITWIMWYEFFASVWCFFAAILSVIILCIMMSQKEKK